MANRAQGAAAVFVPAGDREPPQNVFLDAARVLMLFGAVATIGASSAEAEPMPAFLSLLLWLLGVCVLALVVPVAGGRFPHVALATTVMAIVTILKHLFTL